MKYLSEKCAKCVFHTSVFEGQMSNEFTHKCQATNRHNKTIPLTHVINNGAPDWCPHRITIEKPKQIKVNKKAPWYCE
jgi:hypothetical protein